MKKYVPSTGETTIFVYNASGQLVAEYSTQTSATPQVSYLTSDHLGSPRINTDQNGAVISRHDYQPFGEEIARASYGADDVRKQFTGYERDDETNLDFAQARYYSANLGRFSSPDVFWKDSNIRSPQTWNKYVYVRNNALNLTDPFGEKAKVTIKTDKEKKTVDITIDASMGVYVRSGEYSQEEIDAQITKMKDQISGLYGCSDCEENGIKVNITVNLTVQQYDNEASAVEDAKKGKIDNVVGLMRGRFVDNEGSGGIAYSVSGETFDRMVVATETREKNTYAHEFGHLLGADGHIPEGQIGLMQGYRPLNPGLTWGDYHHIFDSVLVKHDSPRVLGYQSRNVRGQNWKTPITGVSNPSTDYVRAPKYWYDPLKK